MVDEFASVWPVVALEGVGDLIGDARPGLVAVDGGRRLGWANPAAATLFAAAPALGAPLALDRRLADRIARFAGRAAPGEEARELLRFTAAGRPSLRTVVFRRPVDADDAVIAIVDGAAEPAADPIAAGLTPFAADGGLAALFDADGEVLGVAGDLAIAENAVAEIEAALAEADEIAVLERTVTTSTARHRLVLVRLGDRPDARRLLRLSPSEAAAAPLPAAPEAEPEIAPETAPDQAPIEPTDAAIADDVDALPETAPIEAAEPVTTEIEADDEPMPRAAPPSEAADATALAAEDETSAVLVPAPLAAIPADAAVPPAPSPETVAPPAPATDDAGIDEAATDEDRFVAAPPLALDLFGDVDETEDQLDRAWRRAADAGEHPETPALAVTPEAVAGSPPAPESPPAPIAADAGTANETAPPIAETVATPDATSDDDRALVAAEVPPPLVAHGEPEGVEVEDLLPEPRPLDATVDGADADSATLDAASPGPETPPEAMAADESDAAAVRVQEAAVPAAGFVFTPLERPVKFVWQMDADRRFTLVSHEFAAIVGPAAADLVGRRWDEIIRLFDLDRDGAVDRALSRRDTWSGRTVLWPVQGTATRIPVDLAALPAFDRGRTFVGFRGFGTCRTDPPEADPRAVGLRLAAAPSPAVPEAPLAEAPPAPVAPPLAATEPEPSSAPLPDDVAAWAPSTPADAPAVARIDEAQVEPPLFPDDGESALDDGDHPIEPSFAGDIGDDPVFERVADTALTDAERALRDALDDFGLPLLAAPADAADTVVSPPPIALSVAGEPVSATPDVAPGSQTPDRVAPEPVAPAPGIADLVAPEPATRETPAPEPTAPEPAEPRPAPRLVDLPKSGEAPAEATRLSVPERHAFRQIARALGARIEGETDLDDPPAPPRAPAPRPPAATAAPVAPPAAPIAALDARLLDRLPLALALLQDETLIHANERFLTLLRYPDLATLRAAGGVDALFAGPHAARRFETADGRPMALIAHDGTVVPCDARIATVPLDGSSGLLLTLTEHVAPAAAAPTPTAPVVATGSTAERERIDELQAIVDTATDGVLMLDAAGLVLSANAGAEALFGVERRAMIGRPLTDRLAPESRRSAMDYLDGLSANGVASVLNDGREVIGVVAPEGLIPLFMTIGRVSTGPIAKYCAVLRDITQWKKSEEELTAARRRAEEASIHKSDFLAKISHEIRTPLNAIIGFSELMLDERFGPVGNERYKDYLRDIHVSGSHIMSLVNDLLDLSKVEAGKMDLRFEAVPLAEVVSECVALMQPQANRERIIIRSSLPAGVPPVVADPRSMRQVVLNLLSNAVKFTPAGGQVIVSITLEDNGEVALRVRDTGYGMSDKEMQTALEPFRQLHTTRSRSGGTGLGLPLTKALTEANRAAFRIDSTVGQGTLVSVTFPVTRVLAG
jgi:PAS domain S-box-containing protein